MIQQRFTVIVVRIVCAALSMCLFFGNKADAVRPRFDVEQKLRADGQWDAYVEQMNQARRQGLNQADPMLLAGTAPAVAGTLRTLVILVDFSDNPYTSNQNTPPSYFENLLFSTNDPGASLTDYYLENSYGQTLVQGDVVGWFRMPQSYSYYVAGARGLNLSPPNARELARDAALAADGAGVDFSQYDGDNNGFVDGFFVVHAGPGFEETGNDNHIHSHKWSLISSLNLDGKIISAYTMQPEEQGDMLAPVNIGVFCHEFGHFLGLPDLYDTDGTSQGLDEWALMAAGNYSKSDGSSPSHFCAWSKIALGWVTPVQPASNMTSVVIPQIEYNSVVYRLWTNGAGGTEYFLVENRQRSGFDRFLPGGGLLIYHVDDALGGPAPNNREWYPAFADSGHYKVALEQADGKYELETSPATSLSADGDDPYPGNKLVTAFDDLTVPDSRDYFGFSSQVAVWNISAPGSTMTANLDVVFSRPNFVLQGLAFTDNGNSNGAPDPGEQVSLVVTHLNHWLGVSDAQLTVATDDTAISFTSNSVALGVVGTGETASNSSPITFNVPAGKPSRTTDFYITITALAGGYILQDTVRVSVGAPQILIVNDDNRTTNNAQSYDTAFYFPVLDARRMPYDGWEVVSQGAPTTMANYPIVLWYTGDFRTQLVGAADSILTAEEIIAIKSYLDGGGNLLLTGQQIALYLDSTDTAFMNNYLKCSYWGPTTDFLAHGVSGDVITDSTGFILGGTGGAQNQGLKDLIIPIGSALPILTETTVTNYTAIRVDTNYNLVFVSFGLEGIGDDAQVPPFEQFPKSVFINRTIDWFLSIAADVGDDELPIIPESFELKANYPNPFNPFTTISFTVVTKPTFARLVIYNLLGREVRDLASGYFTPGEYRYLWNGKNDAGLEMGSGVYFYRLTMGGESVTRKMLMLK